MQAPNTPDNEDERLQALVATGLLDTAPEERFDRLTRLAKRIFKTRIAVISLIDTERQWFKSRQGLDACETSRKVSFCGHAILRRDILEVQDAREDSRFSDNPLVTGGPQIRFYAGAPLRGANGCVLGTLCIIDDHPRSLTDDERLSLRELADCVEDELATIDRYRLASVVRQTTNGVVITDLDGHIEWINEGFTRLTGFDLDEVRGQSPGSILKGVDTNPKTVAQMQAAIAAHLPFEVEIINYDKYGRPYWVHINCNLLLDGRGRHEGFMAIHSDLTEVKQAEQVKLALTATVSHELRTPLTSIAGAIGLLTGGTAGPLPEAAHNLLAIADKNCQRLRALTDDLLDMEKLLAGKSSFTFQNLELRPLLDQALREHQPFADAHGVRLTLVDHCGHALVRTDAGRFQQVMNNLLSNAVKFSPDSGEVVVTAHPVDQAVRVEVRDRGPGIDLAFHPLVFQQFAQADTSDTRQRGGSGLGLAITRELVEQMHGRIGFESTPGHGANFWFELRTSPEDLQPTIDAAADHSEREAPGNPTLPRTPDT